MSFRQGARQFFERRGAPTPPLPYDAEVEYLESTGTQYIDTGVLLGSNLNMVVRHMFTEVGGAEYNFPAGCFASRRWFGFGLQQNSSYYARGGYASLTSYSTIEVGSQGPENFVYANLTDWRIATLDSTQGENGGYFVLDGYEPRTQTAWTGTGTAHIYLFGANYASSARPAKCKISSASITSTATGEELIKYKAVRKDGVGYMYDSVTGTLIGNSGTGAFNIGPDK